MFQLPQFVWALRSSVCDIFINFLLIDATARSKISGDQKRFFIALSLYPLSFFANTPFKFLGNREYGNINNFFLFVKTCNKLCLTRNKIFDMLYTLQLFSVHNPFHLHFNLLVKWFVQCKSTKTKQEISKILMNRLTYFFFLFIYLFRPKRSNYIFYWISSLHVHVHDIKLAEHDVKPRQLKQLSQY